MSQVPGSRNWLVPLTWLVSVAIAAALGAWAGLTALALPAPPGDSPTPALYQVSVGTVSRSQSFTARADWQGVPAGRSGASGTVTTVELLPGQEVEAGNRLYSIELRPVFVAEGAIPAFRSLSEGARGGDVAQLQAFLADAGLYGGTVSGRFDRRTERAVMAWQRRSGVETDGIVRRGDIVFLPHLPVRATPAERLAVGESLGPGEIILRVLPEAPAFSITLSADQAGLVPLSGSVAVHVGDDTWTGAIGTTATSPVGELILTIVGIDGGALCGSDCDRVPVDASSLYRAEIVSVPERTGPLVPVAALQTRPDGSVFVIDEGGREIEVTIVAAADGRAVVEGIEAGRVVQLFGGPSTPPASVPQTPAP